MKKVLGYIKVALGVGLGLLLIAAFAVESSKPMPKNAHVMVDDIAKTYHSPMYFYENNVDGWQKLRLTTAEEAYRRGYEPDAKSRDAGYFIHDKGALIWTWLEDAGITTRKERWNPDGSWNW